jgi:hypothetical protein
MNTVELMIHKTKKVVPSLTDHQPSRVLGRLRMRRLNG